jgi:hypothetical protein
VYQQQQQQQQQQEQQQQQQDAENPFLDPPFSRIKTGALILTALRKITRIIYSFSIMNFSLSMIPADCHVWVNRCQRADPIGQEELVSHT